MKNLIFNPFHMIEDAESASDSDIRETLLEQAIRFLSTQGDTQSADVQHAIGYAWYLRPADTEMRDESVMHHLSNAVRINPDHKLALLYLGHHYYDRGKFVKALNILSKFQTREFSASDQAWRDTKVSELILCCRLRLRDQRYVKEALHRFCEALTYCDEEMNPTPNELTEVLLEQLSARDGVMPATGARSDKRTRADA